NQSNHRIESINQSTRLSRVLFPKMTLVPR
ncbi:MAG: hypothetical protein ACI90V_009881, partial [Bacillariaceae sp.]